jgi:hypothetical protein
VTGHDVAVSGTAADRPPVASTIGGEALGRCEAGGARDARWVSRDGANAPSERRPAAALRPGRESGPELSEQ